MSDIVIIPLFPLNVVLFPDSKLPLYIFEERYKKMINECMNTESVFGMNLFTDKKMFMTGCSASVHSLLSKAGSGEMNIVALGKERYRVISHQPGADGFFTGKIEYFEKENSYFDKSKRDECVLLYNQLVQAVYKDSIEKIDLADSKWIGTDKSVSFFVAEKSGLDLNRKQHLLEIENEDERIDYILEYFKEIMPEINETNRINEIIRNDGYIQ
ncbi:MAG: LON peptidase substrate-binding domain-containing protein [Ignavibacteria bacterium]